MGTFTNEDCNTIRVVSRLDEDLISAVCKNSIVLDAEGCTVEFEGGSIIIRSKGCMTPDIKILNPPPEITDRDWEFEDLY